VRSGHYATHLAATTFELAAIHSGCLGWLMQCRDCQVKKPKMVHARESWSLRTLSSFKIVNFDELRSEEEITWLNNPSYYVLYGLFNKEKLRVFRLWGLIYTLGFNEIHPNPRRLLGFRLRGLISRRYYSWLSWGKSKPENPAKTHKTLEPKNITGFLGYCSLIHPVVLSPYCEP
jgi:hypothetical protein